MYLYLYLNINEESKQLFLILSKEFSFFYNNIQYVMTYELDKC